MTTTTTAKLNGFVPTRAVQSSVLPSKTNKCSPFPCSLRGYSLVLLFWSAPSLISVFGASSGAYDLLCLFCVLFLIQELRPEENNPSLRPFRRFRFGKQRVACLHWILRKIYSSSLCLVDFSLSLSMRIQQKKTPKVQNTQSLHPSEERSPQLLSKK